MFINPYRYGFNGKENDNEVVGTGSGTQDYGARIYNPALGRWLSVDPLHAKYAEKSPYMFASNNPINRIDVDGEDDFHFYYVTTKILIPQLGGGVKTVINQTSFYTVDKNNKKNTYTVHNFNKQGEGGHFGQWQESTNLVSGAEAGNQLMSFNVASSDYKDEVGAPGSRRSQDMEVFGLLNTVRNIEKKEKEQAQVTKMMGLVASIVVPELLTALAGETAVAAEMTTVGRWMSKGEYNTMAETGQMVEGAGGQTFVATGGSEAFTAAPKGSVYAEFQVPTNSLLKGGKEGWFKTLGNGAGNSMKQALSKQGGELLPKIDNLSPILKTK